MTPEVAGRVEAQLRMQSPHGDYIHLPAEFLEQFGVTSTDQLEAFVENGRLVLTPQGVK